MAEVAAARVAGVGAITDDDLDDVDDPATSGAATAATTAAAAGRHSANGDGRATTAPIPRPRSTLCLHVSLPAFIRGARAGDERCELPGVGVVPVALAQEWFIDDAVTQMVVEKGNDVTTVVTESRHISRALNIALRHRDVRSAVANCDTTVGLERDHVKPFAEGGPTSFENLQMLCSYHHGLKTYAGYTLVPGPRGLQILSPEQFAARADGADARAAEHDEPHAAHDVPQDEPPETLLSAEPPPAATGRAAEPPPAATGRAEESQDTKGRNGRGQTGPSAGARPSPPSEPRPRPTRGRPVHPDRVGERERRRSPAGPRRTSSQRGLVKNENRFLYWDAPRPGHRARNRRHHGEQGRPRARRRGGEEDRWPNP